MKYKLRTVRNNLKFLSHNSESFIYNTVFFLFYEMWEKSENWGIKKSKWPFFVYMWQFWVIYIFITVLSQSADLWREKGIVSYCQYFFISGRNSFHIQCCASYLQTIIHYRLLVTVFKSDCYLTILLSQNCNALHNSCFIHTHVQISLYENSCYHKEIYRALD